MIEIIHGDVREVLSRFEDNSFDGVFSDPPYGIKFFNSKWDYSVPDVVIWKEIYRVLKPGANLLCFGGARTYHRMAVNIEDAGFEIRDQLMWIFGAAMPKSLNIGKQLVKTGYDPNEWGGYGTSLKPGFEPLVLARKPIVGTMTENVLNWNCGGLAIEASRIGNQTFTINRFTEGAKPFGDAVGASYESIESTGRYPSNLILDEESAALVDTQRGDGVSRFFYCPKANKTERADNPHPTLKPRDLLEYFSKLIKPPGQDTKLLVPFCGSGSEALASRTAGWNHIVGIELEKEFADYATKRCL